MSTSSSNSCCYFGNSFTEAADVISLQNGADDRYQRHSTSSAHSLTMSSSPAPLPSRLTRRRCESRAFSSSFVVVLVSATSAVLCWNLGVSDAFPTTLGTHHPSHHHHSLPLHPSSPIPTKSLLFWANCHHQHSYIIPQQLRILGRTILMHS